jgi:hypothetical protein
MVDYLAKVRAWAAKSDTAKAIIAVVEKATQDIYVVGMKNGGFSSFSSDDPEKGKGVVFFDIEAKFALKIPDGVDAKKEPKYKAETVSLDPYIAFLHEFGHAKQWIENPYFFNGSVMNSRAAEKTLQDEIQKRAYETAVKQIPAPAKIPVIGKPAVVTSSATPPPPPPMGGKGGVDRKEVKRKVDERLKLAVTRMTKPGWAVRIETDNLISHEWPMCVETGHPKRSYSEITISVS